MDEVAAEGRDLSAEEREFVDRTFAELDEKRGLSETLVAAEKREAEITESMRGLEDVARPVEARTFAAETDSDVLQSLLTGSRRSHTFTPEVRSVLTSSTSAPVPTDFASRVVAQARFNGVLLDPSVVTILTTANGNDFVLPTQTTWSTAAQTAQAGTIATSDPGFGQVTFKAWKHTVMVPVSAEMIRDASIDIEGWIADQAGQALGFEINKKLTLGTGTTESRGIVVAASAGVTGGTGVSGAFTADNLIDLAYSLDQGAELPGFGFMANRASIGAIRKLKTSGGEYVWTPTLAPGQADTVLGFPIYTNPHMAGVGTSAVSVICGHLPSYTVRIAGGLQVSTSTDFAFDQDLTYLKFVWYVDGNLPQTSHIKRFTGGTA
jgi:HK97 family phage major capsid protein